MKSVILGDLHWGARGDNLIHLEYQSRFFDEVFFPFIDKNKITRIYQLGDFMDRRKFVNYNTLHTCKKVFLDECEKRDIELFVLVGNHDIYWRDTLEINCLDELFGSYKCLRTISKPMTVDDGGTKIDIIPWICKDNEKEVFDMIKQSKSEILLGHLELSGFDMLKGVKSEHGDDPSIFSRYTSVISGHYHTRSRQGNIEYLGTPYEITWADCNDQKGFGLLDSESFELQFIPNPFSLFNKIIYNDEDTSYDTVDVLQYQRSYVKIIIAKKNDEKMFDRFIERIYQKAEPIDLTVSDTTLSYREVEQEKIETRDPLTILIGSVENSLPDAKEIRRTIQDLYAEAMTTGVAEE